MRIDVTPNEFLNIVILYLLERLEERSLEMPNETDTKFIRLSEEGEDILEIFKKRNLGTEFKRYRIKTPIVNRNKYNFIKKAFKGEALTDNIIKIKVENKDE